MGCVDKRRGSIIAGCGLLWYDVILEAVVAKKRGCEGAMQLLRRHCLAEMILEIAKEDAGT